MMTHKKSHYLTQCTLTISIALCFAGQAVQAQSQTQIQTDIQPPPLSSIDVASARALEDKALKAQYTQTLQACASKIAPAHCRRKAMLDYRQEQHAVKLKRDQQALAEKQKKYAQSQLEKTRNASTAKQGVDSQGKALERAPLSKAQPKSNTSPVRPLSKPSSTKPSLQNAPAKKPLAQKSPPKQAQSKLNAPVKPIAAQPTAEQRRANVEKTAKKENELVLRKTQVQSKQAKRAAKDAQRRAAGFTVDKP